MKLIKTLFCGTGILPVGPVGVSPADLPENELSTGKMPVCPTDKMSVPL